MVTIVSISMVILGFILSVYGGVVLSLPNAMRHSDGSLNQGKITFFSFLTGASALLLIAGVIIYYVVPGNLP